MTIATKEFEQLRAFLKDMFQFEEHDLDFGIYRIIRLKRQYIQGFIDGEGENSLRATVTSALSGVQNTQSETARNWLGAFAAQFGEMGRPLWQALADNPGDEAALIRFKSLFAMPVLSDDQREQAEHQLKAFLETRQLSAEQLEVKVYNHLLNFFELYYQNGDFGYNTRAASAFKVPYEADYDGSDTLFHWKHKDSYYIKTGNGFHSVRCEVGGKWLEFRLASGDEEGEEGEEGEETTERNNNKESGIKHYRLLDIQSIDDTEADGSSKTVWQVRFALAIVSTPKVELYQRIWETIFADGTDLAPYLHKKPGKGEPAPGQPMFNNLTGDYEKTDGGQVKGLGQLRIKFDKYTEELAKRDEFSALGKNIVERQQALRQDAQAIALWQLDRNLNKFYVGNDADYFIHKDLRGFLTREKGRFIKQVAFSDLEALLHAGDNNTTTLIARAFNVVADTLIGFLSAIENFQKGLFELKKKVVDTHYLISVGKIPAAFYERLFACEAQRHEWSEVYKVDFAESVQLAEHPTLVVDTNLYRDSDPSFQDDLLSLSEFDNLDEQTDGLLINSENWQALNLLKEKFREQVKGIYIDPPYNTGDDGFIYKDSFKHSSWVSMISERVDLARELLRHDGVFFSSIDRDENRNYVPALFQLFGEGNFVEEIIWQKSYGGGSKTKHVNNLHEYVLCFANNKISLPNMVLPPNPEVKKYYKFSDNKEAIRGKYRTQPLHTTSNDYRVNLTYPIPVPSAVAGSPEWNNEFRQLQKLVKEERLLISLIEDRWVVTVDGFEWIGCLIAPEHQWQWAWTPTAKDAYIDNELLFEKNKNGDFVVNYKQYERYDDGSERGSKLGSVLVGPYTQTGTSEQKNILGRIVVKYPKPVGLIEQLLGVFFEEKDGHYFDFFAGSAPTFEAIQRLNQIDNGKRKVVLIEMGRHFDTATRERTKRVIYSPNWFNGIPLKNNNKRQYIVKSQCLEQYEDLLDNLAPVWDDGTLPPKIPVRYLFRPEQNALSASLDLSRPFSQILRVGKAREEKTIDLMETWCYLQGYWIKSRRMYREFNRPYLAVETTHGTLVIFRDIDDAEDDTANLKAILEKYLNEHGVSLIQRLEVNHDADLRKLTIETILITATDFMRGAQWN